MINKFSYLTLNSQTYSGNRLVSFCNYKLPALQLNSFEYHLYGFIKNFISEKPVITVKTSGSTGKPKEIELSKKGMIESAKLTGDFLRLNKGDKALLCLPVEFIAGKMMVVRAFVLGLNLITTEPSSNPLKNIDETFDFAAMTPMQVHNILKSNDGYEKLNNINNLIIGGGDISKNLLQKIKKLKNKTFHTYGMTETITHIAMKRLNGNNPDTCFKALKNISFEKDETDCLVINAPHISEKKIITNDIVELKNRFEFEFKGRFDNVINSGGIKIFPESVESRLSAFIKKKFIIAGLPDEKLGEKTVLIIETGNGDKNIFKTAISKAGLTKYEQPKELFFINKFPETENGKTDRRKLLLNLKKNTD